MRLLLVEDDAEITRVFEAETSALGVEMTHVTNRSDAIEQLEKAEFDLLVCDLKIPSSSEGSDEEPAHGKAVLTNALRDVRGMPIIAFSAYGTVELMQELLRNARQADFLGGGQQREMLVFYKKDELPDCTELIREIADGIRSLEEEIEIATGGESVDLSWAQERVVRLYARRLEATVVHVSALAGGLSGARVLRLRLERTGTHVASVVAKLDHGENVRDEYKRVEGSVAPALASGDYPSAVTLIDAGAGAAGGVFYRFAGGFERSLFDGIRWGDLDAQSVVSSLKGTLSPWRDGAPVERMDLSRLRTVMVREGEIPDQHSGLVADEGLKLDVRWCVAHGDLHIFNVLVSDEGEVMVIDFAATQEAPACLDPITLELSAIFHPDSRQLLDGWPSSDQAEHWGDLEVYLEGCPIEDFVQACRSWAFEVAVADREVFATLYAYALRQLKFEDTPHEIAGKLVGCARRRLGV